MSEASTARTIRLRNDMSVPEALHCVVTECLRQLQENTPGIVVRADRVASPDMECVHQARVALRRLRSADKAFSAAGIAPAWQALMQDAQWLASLLGKLRDLQMLITVTLPPIAAAHAGTIDFAPLQTELTLRSERAHAKLLSALRSKRYRNWLQCLQLWLDAEGSTTQTRLPTFARNALSKRWRQVDALVKRWEKLDQAQRHTLRKRVKKMRYTIEFFASLYAPKAVAKYVKYLAAIQKALGNLNDTATAQELLRPLLRRTETALAVSATLGWLNCASATQRDVAVTAISNWQRHSPFW